MSRILDTMTVAEAVAYCYKHRNRFISETYAAGAEGTEAFECLIEILESGTIKPNQLPEYGMDYEVAPLNPDAWIMG